MFSCLQYTVCTCRANVIEKSVLNGSYICLPCMHVIH